MTIDGEAPQAPGLGTRPALSLSKGGFFFPPFFCPADKRKEKYFYEKHA
jgi:hypothetical protein